MYTYINVRIYKQGICIYKYVHTQFCNFYYSAGSFVHCGKVHFGKLFTFLLIFLTVFFLQCVYTQQAGRTPVLQQKWQNAEKSPNFQEKTQYLMNTLYILSVVQTAV